MKVALVVMPFAAADRPSLSAGLLQAGLKRCGIECCSKYFNLTFERMLGPSGYRALSQDSGMVPLAGEWAFSQAYYGQQLSDWERYRREVLDDPLWGMDPERHAAIQRVVEVAPAFLRVAFESSDWGEYDLVGFTSTFEQTLPSLCLARMIRQRYPGVLLAFGGANFEGNMGRPYIEGYDFIDFVSTGEADVSLPQLCCNLREVKEGRAPELEVPPGFLYRRHSEVCGAPASAGAFVTLEELAVPDYDDYFRVARASAADGQKFLPIEASRGCWWGQKSHCTFCGLNGKTMAFRQKSWQRVAEETEDLQGRYGALPLQFADNILAMGFFETLLPFWAEVKHSTDKFFEIKSNLDRSQLEQLRAAGITTVQAGVESVSDHTLKVMSKGVSGAQNVALVRWCTELGIHPYWNVLYGFPHERLEEYEKTLAVLRQMTHLPAPSTVTLIRMDRFSPNFTRWRDLGFTEIGPMPAYRHIFPFDEEELGKLAYYFRYEHPQMSAAVLAGAELERFGWEWRERHERGENGELAVKPHWQGGYVLIDSRYNFPRRTRRLDPLELAVLLACDAPTSRATALKRAGTTVGADPESEPLIEETLDKLMAESIVAQVGARLINLALLPPRSRQVQDFPMIEMAGHTSTGLTGGNYHGRATEVLGDCRR